MPTYIPQNRQGYNIEISPSDDLRQLIKVVPFYTGTNIMFDLLLTIFKGNKITEDFKIKWGLYDSKNIKIDSGTCAITLNDIKSTRWDWIKFWEYFKKNSVDRYLYSNAITYAKRRVIKIKRLLIIDTYQLRLQIQSSVINSEDMVLAQFKLQDIDEHGSQVVYIILSAIFGAVAGVISSVIYLTFFGRG